MKEGVPHWSVNLPVARRRAAGELVSDQSALRSIAAADPDAEVRAAALDRMTDLKSIASLYAGEKSAEVRRIIVQRVEDTRLLGTWAKRETSSYVREAIYQRLWRDAEGIDADAPEQGSEADAASFDRPLDFAVAKYRRALDRLYGRRDLPHDPAGEVQRQFIEELGNAISCSYPFQRVAVLFSFHDEGRLQWFGIDHEGGSLLAESAVTRARLVELERRLKASMGVSGAASLRAPRLVREVADRAAPPPGEDWKDVNREVSRTLMPQALVDALTGWTDLEHLVIIPTANLQQFPLAMLQPFGDDTYLIDRYSISIAPSLFEVERVMTRRLAAGWTGGREVPFRPERPLIIGNPTCPRDGEWVFPDLPGARDEAVAVARRLSASCYTGDRATRAQVLASAATSDLLYLATHAVASEDDPLEHSFVLLAGEAPFWTAREIQGSSLSAKLAVLSACQTGLGQVHDAGIIGLSRAFQLAGVDDVVMSLWSVDDTVTRELMEVFIAAADRSTYFPAGALRSAMRSCRERHPEPKYWAPFTTFGIPW